MAKFKVIVSDPRGGTSKTVELEGAKAVPLLGRVIGEKVDGSLVGLKGETLVITGGSDKDGFPMRGDVHGGVKAKVLLSGGPGFHPPRKGERRRKTVRGNTITEDVTQINMKILRAGPAAGASRVEAREP